MALAANSPNLEWRGSPGPSDIHDLKSGETEVFFKHGFAGYKGDGEGLTAALASGDDFAGVHVGDEISTVAGDRVKIRHAGIFKVSNLATAVANAEDAQGSKVYIDVSAAHLDDPIGVRLGGDATFIPAAGDLVIGRCLEWIDSTTIVVKLTDHVEVV